MAETWTEISELWHRVNQRIGERMRQAFRGAKLPPITILLVKIIGREPGVTVSELARRSDLAKSHVSKMVDQLTHRGFLEKRTDPTDQRLVRLYPTQSAQLYIAEMENRAHGVLAEVFAELAPEQKEAVKQGLSILLTALDNNRPNIDFSIPGNSEPGQ